MGQSTTALSVFWMGDGRRWRSRGNERDSVSREEGGTEKQRKNSGGEEEEAM